MEQTTKKRIGIIIISSIIGICVMSFILLLTKQMTLPFLYNSKKGQDWTLGYTTSTSPMNIDYDSITWIENDRFDPIASCIMADPFVIEKDDKLYIFYEEMSGKRNSTHGNISVLESTDGVSWNRLGYALEAKFHLSWPFVFKYNKEFYMLPEKTATNELSLYKAINFPLKWKKEKVLFSNIGYTDPIIYFENSICYLFIEMNKQLCLFYSIDLLSNDWKEHPMSPISDSPYSRLAGEVKKIDDKLYLFAQESFDSYGTGVHAFEITTIDTTIFTMQKIKEPVLWKNGNSYSKDGMHTLNFVEYDETYFIVVDGTKKVEATPWKWSWNNFPEFHWFWRQSN